MEKKQSAICDGSLPADPMTLDHGRAASLLLEYVATPAFRSAEEHEKVVQDNPFRRPVRPEDFGEMVDFSSPLTEHTAFSLGGLLTQRVLMNMNEADLVFVPPSPEVADDVRRDGEAFYSARTRMLGTLLQPFLERHVFGFLPSLHEFDPSSISNKEGLRRYIRDVETRLTSSDSTYARVINAVSDREQVARQFVIQVIGTEATRASAFLRLLAGIYGPPQHGVARWLHRYPDNNLVCEAVTGDRRSRLAMSLDLVPHPHAHWQFYLTGAMGVTNWLHGVCRDHSKLAEAIGAMLYAGMDFQATRRQHSAMLSDVFGAENTDTTLFDDAVDRSLEEEWETLVDPLIQRLGDRSIAAIARGFETCRAIHALAACDFEAQFTWADRSDQSIRFARGFMDKIKSEHIDVDLETFIEPREMCSTTHVHDTDRLLVIESGTMEFWNSFGHSMQFDPGDVMFVPRHRLHGSTVLSESCTYHQPIVTPDVMRTIPGWEELTPPERTSSCTRTTGNVSRP